MEEGIAIALVVAACLCVVLVWYVRSRSKSPGAAAFDKGCAAEDLDEKIRWFTTAIELNPDFTEAHYNRGNAYHHEGQFDRAIQDYDKAIQLKPNLAKAYDNRAVAYFCKRDFDRAWADVKMCRRLGGKIDPAFLEQLKKASGRKE